MVFSLGAIESSLRINIALQRGGVAEKTPLGNRLPKGVQRRSPRARPGALWGAKWGVTAPSRPVAQRWVEPNKGT